MRRSKFMKKPLHDQEWATVLHCCREILENRQAGLSVMEKEMDWQRVVTIAQKHGLTSFVYLRLAENYRELVPEEVLSQLKTIYVQNSRRNTYLGTSLIRILNLLEKNHIKAMPFKGPVQAEMIYNDIGARIFSDLDILVQKENVVQARDLILSQGFQTCVNIPESQIKNYLEKENFFQIADNIKGINIDLHWEITGRYNLVPIYYPLSKQEIHHAALLGKTIGTLNHDDLLIYLCIHGSSHCWEKLELIYSVAKILTSARISNWENILKKAKKLKAWPTMLSKKYHDMAFTERLSWRFSPFHFHIRDTIPDGIKYLLRLFFQPTIREWDKYPLPDFLLPLYYILRPCSLIKEALGVRLGVIGVIGK